MYKIRELRKKRNRERGCRRNTGTRKRRKLNGEDEQQVFDLPPQSDNKGDEDMKRKEIEDNCLEQPRPKQRKISHFFKLQTS